jgi:phytoene dehydrogenase-like protein
MKYDAIIVGSGIAGLTSAAFLCKFEKNILLCEKEDHLGGLIGSFDYKGFTFDTGIRAMENSGVLFPMLKQLDLNLDFVHNDVSIGIEEDIVNLTSEDSIAAYQDMLSHQFPNDSDSITALIEIIKKTMDYMHILYGIDNPLFIDLKEDREYIMKTLLPWMFKYLTTVGKIKQLNTPVEVYLKTITENQVLIDMIVQHFFTNTPAFFALSYFSLYLDYKYPKGGTGALISKLTEYIQKNGCTIKTNTLIQKVNPAEKTITDSNGTVYQYEKMIWAADAKALYSSICRIDLLPGGISRRIKNWKAFISDKTGGNSVLTLYLTVDIDKSYFEKISGAHFFYTPQKQGLSALPVERIRNIDGSYTEDHDALFEWIREFLQLTTYEISIPVMRDESLAPQGKTGIIISTLMDYALVKHIGEHGWYDAFKALCQEAITKSLIDSVYPKLDGHIIDRFVSTPLTIEKRTGNTGGAITGWAFTNDTIPAISSMPQIAKSIRTPIPDVIQAGQWTYSPSGFPISIITAKLAADYVAKKLKR